MRRFAVLFFGLGLALPAFAGESVRLTYLDIQGKGNQKFTDDLGGAEGNSLRNVIEGDEKLDDVRFKVGDKFIHLKGDKEPDLPAKVEGIKVEARCDRLHILHSTAHGEGQGPQDDGSEIGAYIIHYDDGKTERIP